MYPSDFADAVSRTALPINEHCRSCVSSTFTRMGESLEFWHWKTRHVFACAYLWLSGLGFILSFIVLAVFWESNEGSYRLGIYSIALLLLVLHGVGWFYFYVLTCAYADRWAGVPAAYDWLQGTSVRVFLDTGQGGDMRPRLHIHQFPRSGKPHMQYYSTVSGCVYSNLPHDKQAEGVTFLDFTFPKRFFRPQLFYKPDTKEIGFVVTDKVADKPQILNLTAEAITIREADGCVKEWRLEDVEGLLRAYSEWDSVSKLLPLDYKPPHNTSQASAETS